MNTVTKTSRDLIQKTDVPVGVSGAWEVARFEVTSDGARFENLRAAIGGSARSIVAGEYTRLMRNRTLVMSDTPAEMDDIWEPVHRASGVCLIDGLGLGIVTEAILRKKEVTQVIVVEIAQEVIDLVGLHLEDRWGSRLELHRGDAFTFQPPRGVRFGVVWHDIWDNICTDNRAGMSRLKRRYESRTDWQGCWCEHYARR